jgi:hypothetical protein
LNGPKNFIDESQDGFLHATIWMMFHGLHEVVSSSPPRGTHAANSPTMLVVQSLDENHGPFDMVYNPWLVWEVAFMWGYVEFILHVFQVLLIIFTPRNLCCMST